MTSDPSGLTLIVVAYHRAEQLAALLASAAGQATEVIVVNVEDDTDITAVAGAHGARVVALPGNPGYAAAVNLGASLTTTPFAAFCNDDLELAADCLPALGRALRDGADVAVPRLRRPDGTVEPSIARLLTPLALLGEWVMLPDDPHRLPAWLRGRLPVQKWRRPEQPEAVAVAEAALVASATSLLRRWPIPEAYFLYWEEHEWFHQLRLAGCRAVYVPGSVATHAGWDEISPAKSRLLARNAVRCLVRTGGRRGATVGWPLTIVWWLRLCVVDGLRFASRRTPASRARLAARTAGLAAAIGAWRELAPRPHRHRAVVSS